MLAELGLAADAAAMAYLGVRDFKTTEFHGGELVLGAAAGAVALYASTLVAGLPPGPVACGVALSLLALVALAHAGKLGHADLLLAPRLPVVTALALASPLTIIVFLAGAAVAFLVHRLIAVRPHVCRGSWLASRAGVDKRFFLESPLAFPPGAPVEVPVEEQGRLKKDYVGSGECVEAVVAVPAMGVYACGYVAALLAYLAGLYVA